jgi:hypothetical protein
MSVAIPVRARRSVKASEENVFVGDVLGLAEEPMKEGFAKNEYNHRDEPGEG